MDKIASILLDIKAVSLRINPPFVWASGIKSPIYTDNRLLLSHPKERAAIVDAFLHAIKKHNIKMDGIAATATAGIPWGAWVAEKLDLPLIYVRSSPKGHGKGNMVEGNVEIGKNYLVIEDLISTGQSSRNTIRAVREMGGIATHVLAIFSYELPTSKAEFAEDNIEAHTLTTFSHLISEAVKKGYLKEEEQAEVMRWKEMPDGWAK